MKKVFAIHDISGIGKCSLTAALPIISAAGVECCPIPTAVLSTQTGDIDGYTFRDLTQDLENYIHHWKILGIEPDCIYSGYLGSKSQIDIISNLIDETKEYNPLIVIDPAMADFGELYRGFTNDFAGKMKKLCKKADIIVPNITEASILTGKEYKGAPHEKEYINSLVFALQKEFSCHICLTGVSLNENELGLCVLNKDGSEPFYIASSLIKGRYYGTGDIFASSLVACLMNDLSLENSAAKALEFTHASIEACFNDKTDPRFGVPFEKCLKILDF